MWYFSDNGLPEWNKVLFESVPEERCPLILMLHKDTILVYYM